MKFNLDNLVAEFEELEQKLGNPVTLYREYKDINTALEENKEML
jgi:phage regulator Rha-like protein